MSSSKKKCIVTIYFKSTVVAFSVDDKRYPDRAIPFRDCYNKPENCSDFLKELSARIPINVIEAIVFVTDRFPAIPLKKLQLFHEQLRDFCKNHEIFCHFPNQETAFINGLIMNAKPNVEEYGCVAIMLAAPGIIVCHILIRVGKYFKLIEVDRFEVRDLVKNKRDLMERFDVEFVITCNMATHSDPRIFSGQIDFSDLIKNVYSDVNVFYDERCYFDIICDGALKMIKCLMDGKEHKHTVKYFCNTEVTVSPTLVKCGHAETLPFKKSIIHHVKNDSFLSIIETGLGLIKRIDLNQFNYANVKITFELDIDMFYDLQIEPIGPPLQTQQPVEKTLGKNLSFRQLNESNDMAKIVFTQHYFSIFIFKKGKKKVVKNADGLIQIPLYISFAEEIAIIGESAEKSLKDKPTFVIYDLMKLCSKNIQKDSKWTFVLTADSENETLIEFDTFRGRRKITPDLFVGMILNFCLGLIEKETGKKFDQLGIQFEGLGSKENFVECFEKASKKINLNLTFL